MLGICALQAQDSTLDSTGHLSFPQNYKNGVMYASIKRGNVIEDIYAQKADIKALQTEGKLPELTTITMEEYANNGGARGQLNRYIIMQKRDKKWRFEAFNADKSLNTAENTNRCLSCHTSSLSGEDIVFTLDSMRNFRLQ